MLDDTTRQLIAGKISAQDLVAEALRRADAPSAAGVFSRRYDADARALAAAADPRREVRSPFLGVPITIKDNLDVAGDVTRAGSTVLAGAPAAKQDAPVVARLRQAGFIILGRTNMTEFAFSGIGINPHYGTPHNPAFTDARIPGGSSSGAGVSVALDIASVAIGTDTGGSVRIPAALCGVVGFKPTITAVSTEGVYPLSPTLDSVGVLARSVADCAAVFNIVRDDRPKSIARPLRGARLAVIANYVTNGVDADVGAAFDAAVSRLAAAGADIASLSLPELDQLPDFNRKGTLVMAEAFAGLKNIVAGRESECDPLIVTRILAGSAISAEDYAAMQQRRTAMQAAALARLDGFDAYLMPTVPIIAPTIDSLSAPERYHAANGLVLRNPSMVNFLGGCAISLPCQDPGEAPVGLALCARAGEDDKLLALARDVEAALRR